MTIQYSQIIFIGVDKHSQSLTNGKVVVKVQPVILVSSLASLSSLLGPDHFILVEDVSTEIEDRYIHTCVDMMLDCGDPLPEHTIHIQYVLNIESGHKQSVMQLHTLYSELEILHYRHHFLESLHSKYQSVCSIPILLFIDDFGIFQNMHQSLKAFYITPAGLPYTEWCKVSNNYTLTLGPHRADMGDAVASFKSIFNDLFMGKCVTINGEDVILNINVLAVTGDIP